MKRFSFALVILMLLAFVYSCAGPIYVVKPPPAAKVEMKPPPPNAKAVWIDGHWAWDGHQYVWINGHWEKKPKGQWVQGHWRARGRGHVWVPGHWRRR